MQLLNFLGICFAQVLFLADIVFKIVQFQYTIFEVLNEFLTHGRTVREERTRAKAANETPDFNPLIRAWGGVTILYRRQLQIQQ